MKNLHIVLAISACLSLVGCSSSDSTYTSRPSFAYDSDIALTSIDNFRIQMTPRMAQAVAAEKGYKLDTRYGSLTFEDLAEQSMMRKRAQGVIYLARLDRSTGVSHEVSIDFDFGKVTGIKLDHVFYGADRAKARPLFERYKERQTKLSQIKKDGKVEVLKFAPNSNSWLILSLLEDDYSLVSFSVKDINYALSEVYNSYGIR